MTPKKTLMYIHGGESFPRYEDFLERLRTKDLWHLPDQSGAVSAKKWTATLAEDLADEYMVMMPPMPNGHNAKYIEWSIWFERHFEYLTDETVLVGHSLGAMFLAKYLSENDLPFQPRAIFLLAGAYALPGFSDKDCGDFLVSPESVKLLLEKTDNLVIMHSEDDFVVPYEHGVALSKAVPEAEFISFADKNHFLTEEFPELLAKIRSLSD